MISCCFIDHQKIIHTLTAIQTLRVLNFIPRFFTKQAIQKSLPSRLQNCVYTVSIDYINQKWQRRIKRVEEEAKHKQKKTIDKHFRCLQVLSAHFKFYRFIKFVILGLRTKFCVCVSVVVIITATVTTTTSASFTKTMPAMKLQQIN